MTITNKILKKDEAFQKIYDFSNNFVYKKVRKNDTDEFYSYHINRMLRNSLNFGFNNQSVLYGILLHDIFNSGKKIVYKPVFEDFFRDLINTNINDDNYNLYLHIGLLNSFFLTENFFETKKDLKLLQKIYSLGFNLKNNSDTSNYRKEYFEFIFSRNYKNIFKDENEIKDINEIDFVKQKNNYVFINNQIQKRKKESLIFLLETENFLPILVKAFDSLDNTKKFNTFKRDDLETKLYQLNEINRFFDDMIKNTNQSFIEISPFNNLKYKLKIKLNKLYNLNNELYNRSEEIIHYIIENHKISLKRKVQTD